jgi:hypothetical protein
MINPIKAGITFGLLLAAFHFSWLLLVALGWAQSLIDFIFRLHFIQPIFVIRPFALTTAAGLMFFTFATGFVVALFFGMFWNTLHRYQGLE